MVRKIFTFLCLLGILAGLPKSYAQSQSANDDTGLPPQVIDLYPFPGTEMVNLDPLVITFNQPMDQMSVETAITFAPEIAGGFRWLDERTVNFMPSNRWPIETIYEFTINTTARAENGLALEFPYRAELHTVGALRIGEVTPAPDAAEVDIDSSILVSFNRPVVPLVSTETMDDLAVPLLIEPLVQGVGEWLNTSMYLFTPSEPLGGSTKYTVTVRAGLTAVDGAELANGESERKSHNQASVIW